MLAERAKDHGQKYGKDLEPQRYTAIGKTLDASALVHVQIIGETSKNETPNVEAHPIKSRESDSLIHWCGSSTSSPKVGATGNS